MSHYQIFPQLISSTQAEVEKLHLEWKQFAVAFKETSQHTHTQSGLQATICRLPALLRAQNWQKVCPRVLQQTTGSSFVRSFVRIAKGWSRTYQPTTLAVEKSSALSNEKQATTWKWFVRTKLGLLPLGRSPVYTTWWGDRAGGGGLGSPVGNSFMPKLKHLRNGTERGEEISGGRKWSATVSLEETLSDVLAFCLFWWKSRRSYTSKCWRIAIFHFQMRFLKRA